MTDAPTTRAVPTRVRVAQLSAFVALVCGLIGAVGPAGAQRTTYSWPPPTLPAVTPSSLWYTPLLVSRHRPESISATIPCSPPRALELSASPLTVLATARFPAKADGLAVTREERQLVVRVGDRVVDRAKVLPGPARDSDCVYRLRMGTGNWAIEGGPNDVARAGRLDRMPTVTGLFSALDLSGGSSLSVAVTTEVHAAQTTLRQALAWTLAVLGVASALLLVAIGGRPRPFATARASVRAAIRHLGWEDAVVAVVLLGWWVISPAFWDDGFVIAREEMFSASRGFSQYYTALGTNLPIAYWLEWLQHWLTQTASSLVLLRIPSLVCLAAVWILCRWMLARLVHAPRSEGNVARWTLTSVFLVGALAWGMTVRPEPVTALLATAVAACAVRFLDKETVAPLAIAAIVVPLAVIGHHAGVVAIAPLVAVAPALFRWVRDHVPVATTIVTSSIGLLFVLAFVGSDVEQRRSDAQLARAYGLGADWRDEALRYSLLADAPYGTTLRRASVALIALTAVAFLLRRRRSGRDSIDFAGVTVLAALLLLVLTPSKWPWHFGALVGFAALAAAVEAGRLRGEAERSHGWSVWPFLALGAASVAVAWSWWPRTAWNTIDLRTLGWRPGFEAWFPLSGLSVALPFLLLAGAVLARRVRGGGRDTFRVPWRIAAWTAPILAVPLVVFTVGVIVADTVKTDSWTPARQNVESLTGDADCGLAEDLLVPVLSSVQALRPTAASRPGVEPTWAPPAPVDLPRFTLAPVPGGSARSAWFALPPDRRVGLFVAGAPQSGDRLGLEWGRLGRGGQVVPLGDARIPVDFASEVGAGTVPWRFVVASELPAPMPQSDVARITFRADEVPGTTLAATPLVTYTSEVLADRLGGSRAPALVMPNLLTYFGCVEQPPLRNGVVEVPRHIVTSPGSGRTWPLRYLGASPFDGVVDLYRLDRLPISDSKLPTEDVVVFAVDRRISGARLLPAVAETFVS